MYLLSVHSTRRSTLAVHRCESYADLRELLKVYHALGHKPEMLQVEKREQERAA
jgi:hypothetical protein